MIVKQKGFTLIEAVVVTAIIGIIAAVAWPLFQEQSIKSKRSDGVAAILIASSELERYYSDNATYVMTDAECDTLTTSSKEGFYTITGCKAATAEAYTLTATAGFTDAECVTLTYSSLGKKSYTGTAPSSQRCWGG